MDYSYKVLQCLQGSMELTDVISHPLMEVVLQLEYVVSWSGVALVPVDTPTRSTRRGSTVKVGSEREEREGEGREKGGRGKKEEQTCM